MVLLSISISGLSKQVDIIVQEFIQYLRSPIHICIAKANNVHMQSFSILTFVHKRHLQASKSPKWQKFPWIIIYVLWVRPHTFFDSWCCQLMTAFDAFFNPFKLIKFLQKNHSINSSIINYVIKRNDFLLMNNWFLFGNKFRNSNVYNQLVQRHNA